MQRNKQCLWIDDAKGVYEIMKKVLIAVVAAVIGVVAMLYLWLLITA